MTTLNNFQHIYNECLTLIAKYPNSTYRTKCAKSIINEIINNPLSLWVLSQNYEFRSDWYIVRKFEQKNFRNDLKMYHANKHKL